MSIKNAADLVRAQGRYGDSQLMHVTPKEVQALQTIAQAHGKSLSVNPNTGLPEAFDLGAILPTVAGTVVGSMVGAPWLGAAIGGLGTYATTGSLEKGLMAGLGAFGGASFGAALGAAGAVPSAAPAAVAETALNTGIGELATTATADALASGTTGALGAYTLPGSAASITAPTMVSPAMVSAATPTFGGAIPTGLGPTMEAAASGALASAPTSVSPTLSATQAAGLLGEYGGRAPSLSPAGYADLPLSDRVSALGTGIERLFSDPSGTFSQIGGLKGQGMNLGMMAAPLMSGTFNSSGTSSANTEPKGDIRQQDYDPIGGRYVKRPVVAARDFTGFKPSIFGYAEGGEVEPGVDEANRNQIARFYRTYLGREPDAAGMDYWAKQMQGGATSQDVLSNIKLSQEATGIQQNKALEDYYRDYLGRSPDQAGRDYWLKDLQGGQPLSQVQENIRRSQEAAGIAAAAQQRQQMFSPLPPTAPMTAQTPVQQTGIGMIPNRYQAPVNIPSQGVQDYNQLLANRANYEYNVMPMPQAMRPRTPVEQAAARDRQLIGQQMVLNSINKGAAPAVKEEERRPVEGERVQENIGGWGSNAAGGRIQKYAQGGIMSAPKFQAGGEMESDAFVIPADVVSALGNGSTDAGVRKLNDYLGVALLIEGEGDGLSDDIPATIDGEQPARVADGEVYIPADIVAQLGEGDPEEGAEMLYELIDRVRQAAHGKKTQQREVDLDEVMPE